MAIDFGYWLGLAWNRHFIIAIIISLLTALVIAYRYQVMISYCREKISFLHSIFVTYLSALLGHIFPIKVGSLIAKPSATKFFSKIPVKKVIFVTVFEQIFESLWQTILLVLIIIFIGGRFLFNNIFLDIGVFLLFLFITILTFIKHDKVISFLWRFKGLVPGRIKKIAKKAGLSEENTKEAMANALKYSSNLKFLVTITLITVPFVLASPLVVIELAKIFSIDLPYTVAFASFWASVIIGRLSYIPGGLGSREITMAGLLLAFGIPAGTTIKLTILTRIVALVPMLLVGGAVSIYISSKIPFRKFIEKPKLSPEEK